MPIQIWSSFAVILHYCRPKEPLKLFEQFLDVFINQEKKLRQCNAEDIKMEDIKTSILRSFDDELEQMGASLTDFPEMPQTPPLSEEEQIAMVFRDEMFELQPLLNKTQVQLCEDIYRAELI